MGSSIAWQPLSWTLEGSPLFWPNPWHPQKPPCRAAASSGLEAVVGPALGPLATSGLACGHCLWAQPAVTLYFSPPLVAGPRYEPLHREKVAPNCCPQQAKR